jgi:hypothetical protein
VRAAPHGVLRVVGTLTLVATGSLVAASCSSGGGSPSALTTTTGSAGSTGSTGNTGNTGTTTTTAQPTTTLTITGTGPAGTVTIGDGTQISQHNDVALPYTYTLPDNPNFASINAQTSSGSPSATISCSISGGNVPGSGTVTNNSTGAYAVVQCSTALDT